MVAPCGDGWDLCPMLVLSCTWSSPDPHHPSLCLALPGCLPKTSLTLQSPERCWSVLGGSVPSLHGQICSHGRRALTQNPHTSAHIYIGGGVFTHAKYTRNYHSPEGVSRASSLTLASSGTSGGSTISPGTVSRRIMHRGRY